MKKTNILLQTLAALMACLLLLTSCGTGATETQAKETETAAETAEDTENTESESETEAEAETETETPDTTAEILVSSENYQVTDAMIPYYEYLVFGDMFNRYFNFYYSYLYDANTAYSYAQSQMASYTLDDFFDSAMNYACENLVLCEAAAADGITLTAEDTASVEQTVALFADNITEILGENVTENDVRRAAKLEILAGKYYEKFSEETPKTITDKDIQAYIESNKSSFYAADCLRFSITLASADYADAEAFAAARALGESYIGQLTDAKTENDFLALVVRYVIDRDLQSAVDQSVPLEVYPTPDTLAPMKTEMVNAILSVVIDGAEPQLPFDGSTTLGAAMNEVYLSLGSGCVTELNALVSSLPYEESPTSDTVRRLIDPTTAPFTTMTEGQSTAEQYSQTVYMLLAPLHLNDEETVNVGHILIEAREDTATEAETEAAEAKAQAVLDAYLAGEKTRESFEALAKENTADSGVFYQNVTRGQMVEAFDEWIFSESRQQIGETAIVKTEYGYHIMYWDGKGENTAITSARNGIISERYQSFIEEGVRHLKINEA